MKFRMDGSGARRDLGKGTMLINDKVNYDYYYNPVPVWHRALMIATAAAVGLEIESRPNYTATELLLAAAFF